MSFILIILLLFTATFAIRMGYRVYQSYQCPAEAELSDFFHGKLKKKPDLRRQIITHLGNCTRCREKLDELRSGRTLEDHIVGEDV